jgi:hypothetical protein
VVTGVAVQDVERQEDGLRLETFDGLTREADLMLVVTGRTVLHAPGIDRGQAGTGSRGRTWPGA